MVRPRDAEIYLLHGYWDLGLLFINCSLIRTIVFFCKPNLILTWKYCTPMHNFPYWTNFSMPLNHLQCCSWHVRCITLTFMMPPWESSTHSTTFLLTLTLNLNALFPCPKKCLPLPVCTHWYYNLCMLYVGSMIKTPITNLRFC